MQLSLNNRRFPLLVLLSGLLCTMPGCVLRQTRSVPRKAPVGSSTDREIRELREVSAEQQSQIEALKAATAVQTQALAQEASAQSAAAAANLDLRAQNQALTQSITSLETQTTAALNRPAAGASRATAPTGHATAGDHPIHNEQGGPGTPVTIVQPTTFDIWLDSLAETSMEYAIPEQMNVDQESTVLIVIHGPQDKIRVLPQSVSTSPVRYSPDMQVNLEAPDNPDAFRIERTDQDPAEKPIPLSGYAKWQWNVKALKPKSNATLHVRVFVIYHEESTSKSAVKLEQTFPVKVSVSLRQSFLERSWQWYDQATAAQLWTALASLITAASGWFAFWRKRVGGQPATKASQPKQVPTVHVESMGDLKP